MGRLKKRRLEAMRGGRKCGTGEDYKLKAYGFAVIMGVGTGKGNVLPALARDCRGSGGGEMTTGPARGHSGKM